MRRVAVASLAWLLTGALGGCRYIQDSPTGGRIDSVTLELLEPTDVGSPTEAVSTRAATFNLFARDDQGAQVNEDVDVDLYLASGGIKTGVPTGCSVLEASRIPLATVQLFGGELRDYALDLPAAFGPSALWAEIPNRGAAGASPVIYFPNPRIAEITTPPDFVSPKVAFCNPYNGKFVTVDRATGSGRLYVSAVFTNAFVMVDTGASTFNAIYVFSFSRPSRSIVVGRPLNWVTGNIAKFNGFTQLSFPRYEASDDEPNTTALPPPVKLTTIDLQDVPKMLGYVSRNVEVKGKVCNPFPDNPNDNPDIQRTRDSWLGFNQFIVDADTTCGSISNFTIALPAKKVGDFDPLERIGDDVTIRGVLRNSSGQNPVTDANGSQVSCSDSNPCASGNCQEDGYCWKRAFNFWTVYPSTAADIN